jgi:hypothetical protein
MTLHPFRPGICILQGAVSYSRPSPPEPSVLCGTRTQFCSNVNDCHCRIVTSWIRTRRPHILLVLTPILRYGIDVEMITFFCAVLLAVIPLSLSATYSHPTSRPTEISALTNPTSSPHSKGGDIVIPFCFTYLKTDANTSNVPSTS